MGHLTYLGLILIWAGPIILLQWLLGFDLMLKRWKVWIGAILIPTVYLTFVDSFAIRGHTWTISPEQSLGMFLPLSVPVEEGVFFLVTNTLVVQGIILLSMPGVMERVRRLGRVLRRGPAALAPEADQAAQSISDQTQR